MKDIDKLYQDNFIKVYRYILSISGDPYLAEDITQETFFKAMQKIDSFRGECSLTTWLCKIGRNLFLNHNKRKKHSQNLVNRNLSETFNKSSAEQELIQKEQVMEIMSAIQKLEDPYKEVFSLRTFSGLSFKEIGNMFSRSDSWARVTYHRAKLKIKEELEDER